MTASVAALYPGFLVAGVAAGAATMLIALLWAFFSNLDAGITHYGTGSAPVYFGAGYVSQTTWWRLGFLISPSEPDRLAGVGSVMVEASADVVAQAFLPVSFLDSKMP